LKENMTTNRERLIYVKELKTIEFLELLIDDTYAVLMLLIDV
jgi:hypothetical protein